MNQKFKPSLMVYEGVPNAIHTLLAYRSEPSWCPTWLPAGRLVMGKTEMINQRLKVNCAGVPHDCRKPFVPA
jgi:hypothetical protein